MTKKGPSCIPARVVLALLCATGVMELYMTRTNLSIAIVAMAQTVSSDDMDKEVLRDPYCLRDQNGTLFSNREYLNSSIVELENSNINGTQHPSRLKMTTTQRGNLLASFYYIYWLSAIMGGRIAEKYGAKKLFSASVLIDAIGNFLTPVAAKTHYGLLMLIRCVMGFFQGACFPALHALVSVWIPANEASRFISFSYVANSFGPIFTLNVCGIIINDYGWEPAFYVCGSLGLLWLFFWTILMYDNPVNHPRISEKEKEYILENRKKSNSMPKKTPWIKILTSIPLWANTIAHAGSMFGLAFIMTQLPIYMGSIIGVNIKVNGFLSSLPFLIRFISSNIISWTSNFLSTKVNWTLTTWQRIFTVIGHLFTSVGILFVGYVGCNWLAALSLFCLVMSLNSASLSGYFCNHHQIAPNFAGTALGVSNTVAFFYTTAAPLIVGALTTEETLAEWITVYWILFGNYFISGMIFIIFLSTAVQPWNENKNETSKNCISESGNVLKPELELEMKKINEVEKKSLL